MKKLIFVLLGLLIGFVSCKHPKSHDSMVMPDNKLVLNYPAAFVVNGESNTVSVIKLSDNTVETIKLGEMSMNGHSMSMGTGVMWPHHLSINSSKTQIAIAVPGMDLSAGHSNLMGGMSGKIILIDPNNGIISHIITVPSMNHNAIYNKNGTEIWTSQMENSGKILVFNSTTHVQINSIAVGKMPTEITFSPDGVMAFVANGMDNTVSIINTTTKLVITTLGVGLNPVAAWQGYDGYMYVDNEDGKNISIINITSMSVTGTISLGFTPGYVAHNSTMNELWVTDPIGGKVHYWTWDAAMGMWMHGSAFDTGLGAHAIAFSSDGMTAYVTNQGSGTVSVVSVMNHSETKEIAVGQKPNGIIIKQ